MKHAVLVLLSALALPFALPAAEPIAPAQVAQSQSSATPPPECQSSLTLPDSSLSVRVRFRQVGPDLSAFRMPDGADAAAAAQHRILCLFAQGSALTSDVALRAGEHVFGAGSHSFGFSVSRTGVPDFFMVDGRSSYPLPSRERPVEWPSRGLLMQWEYESRDTLHLVWKLGERAGAIEFRLGSAPAERRVPAEADADADTPR